MSKIKIPHNFPENYNFNTIYPISIQITHSRYTRWGIELSARQTNNSQAGILITSDKDYTQIGILNNISYLKHTYWGTQNGEDSPVTLSFDWLSPATEHGW